MDDVKELDFDKLINRETLTIIDFSATWCMPCRMLTPILEQVSDKMPEIDIYNLDIDDNEEIAKRYRIFSVPTLLAFKEGKVIDTMVGLNSFDDVLAFAKRALKAPIPKD